MLPPTPPTYERSPVPGADMAMLDADRLEQALTRRAPSLLQRMEPMQLAAAFGLVAQSGGRLVPTVAGLVLFGHLPQVVRPEWGVSAVQVDGTRLSDPIVHRLDLDGPLETLLEGAVGFVRDHSGAVPALSTADDPRPEYPGDAVQQAVLNALVHRDFRAGGRASVRLLSDRLEVWSPGGPPAKLALDQMLQTGGVSFPRNPMIAAFLRTFGVMDQLGRGMPTIGHAMAAANAPKPTVAATTVDFCVTLRSRLYTETGTGSGCNDLN